MDWAINIVSWKYDTFEKHSRRPICWVKLEYDEDGTVIIANISIRVQLAVDSTAARVPCPPFLAELRDQKRELVHSWFMNEFPEAP